MTGAATHTERAPCPAATSPSGRSKRRRYCGKSGAFTLKRAVRVLGSRTIDRRTRVGRALAAWCAELADDLGGVATLSTQQRAIIEQAATPRLILDSIDGWLATQPRVIDMRKRALLPVVRERQSLADALVRYLTALGLERKARDPLELNATCKRSSRPRHRPTPPRVRHGAPTCLDLRALYGDRFKLRREADGVTWGATPEAERVWPEQGRSSP